MLSSERAYERNNTPFNISQQMKQALISDGDRDVTRIMNRMAVIEQHETTQETITKLLVLLESGEADRFVAHLY